MLGHIVELLCGGIVGTSPSKSNEYPRNSERLALETCRGASQSHQELNQDHELHQIHELHELIALEVPSSHED